MSGRQPRAFGEAGVCTRWGGPHSSLPPKVRPGKASALLVPQGSHVKHERETLLETRAVKAKTRNLPPKGRQQREEESSRAEAEPSGDSRLGWGQPMTQVPVVRDLGSASVP